MSNYYKDENGFPYLDPIIYNNSSLVKISKKDFDAIVKAINMPTTDQLLQQLTQARKEQERQGVTINGVRYAGDPGDRQAMQESLAFMEDAGIAEFTSWKDSDDVFRIDHPLVDVVDAYRSIGARRAQLIAAEGQYAAQVVDGSLTEVTGLTWP